MRPTNSGFYFAKFLMRTIGQLPIELVAIEDVEHQKEIL
jgi:hypothetical protein